MIEVPAATPAETGANKGKVQNYDWPTSIKPEDNATGLPVNAKGKVAVSIPGNELTVRQFETYQEIRDVAGDQYERVALEVFNAKLSAAQLQTARAKTGKLTLAPADVIAYVRGVIAAFDVASLFAAPAEKTAKSAASRGVRAELANLTAAAENMSKEDLLAAIAALASKTK